jgi:hypothetical protein
MSHKPRLNGGVLFYVNVFFMYGGGNMVRMTMLCDERGYSCNLGKFKKQKVISALLLIQLNRNRLLTASLL